MKAEITKTDLRILNVLWNKNEPMSYGQIVEYEPSLNSNTVQAQLRKLLKNGYIEVSDVGYSGTVLCRYYKPTYTPEEMATESYIEELSSIEGRPQLPDLVCRLLNLEDSADKKKEKIKALEKMLKDYKKEL